MSEKKIISVVMGGKTSGKSILIKEIKKKIGSGDLQKEVQRNTDERVIKSM